MQTTKGHIAVFAAGLIFGVNYWIAKELMLSFTPFQVVFIRIFFATCIFWVCGFWVKQNQKISKKDLLRIFIAGVLGITVNQAMFFAGLNYSSPVETSIIQTLVPILVAVFAAFLIKEKISLKQKTGILLGFAATIIIVTHGKQVSFYDFSFVGNILLIINIIAYSLFLILIKPIMAKYHFISVLKFVFLAGFISYLPVGIIVVQDMSIIGLPLNVWLSLGYVVIAATFISYFLKMYALKTLTATTVGFYTYLQPFIASMIGLISGKEILTIKQLIATLVLCFGVFLVITSNNNFKNDQK